MIVGLINWCSRLCVCVFVAASFSFVLPANGFAQHSPQNLQQNLQVHFPKGSTTVEVPFRFENKTILLDVKINDSAPLVSFGPRINA